ERLVAEVLAIGAEGQVGDIRVGIADDLAVLHDHEDRLLTGGARSRNGLADAGHVVPIGAEDVAGRAVNGWYDAIFERLDAETWPAALRRIRAGDEQAAEALERLKHGAIPCFSG